LPARYNSTICWRNSAGYGGLDLGIVNSFHSKNEVSTEAGQLQSDRAETVSFANGLSIVGQAIALIVSISSRFVECKFLYRASTYCTGGCYEGIVPGRASAGSCDLEWVW
jgi:hypothetical protein